MRFAYADPPYYGHGRRLYGDLHDAAADWDQQEAHVDLLSRLVTDYPDGWALSCNPRDLHWLLPCVPDVRVAAWVKSYHQIRVNVAVQYAWEPVLFSGGRNVLGRNPMVRDWWSGSTAMSGSLIGSKPPGFCRWVLDMLGFDAEQDTVDDLFPGTEIMSRVADQGVLL